MVEFIFLSDFCVYIYVLLCVFEFWIWVGFWCCGCDGVSELGWSCVYNDLEWLSVFDFDLIKWSTGMVFFRIVDMIMFLCILSDISMQMNWSESGFLNFKFVWIFYLVRWFTEMGFWICWSFDMILRLYACKVRYIPVILSFCGFLM